MLEILYEDNHIIAVNKKASDIVQGDKTGDRPLTEYVKDYIKKKYNKPWRSIFRCSTPARQTCKRRYTFRKNKQSTK